MLSGIDPKAFCGFDDAGDGGDAWAGLPAADVHPMPGRASGDTEFAAGAPCMAVGNSCDRARAGAPSFDSASPHPSGSLSAVHLRCAPVRPSGCRARPLRSRRRESALAIGRGRRHRPWRACCWACCRSGAYSQACSLPVRNAHQNPPDSQSRARTQPPDVAIPSGFASSCHPPYPRQQPKGRWAGETLTVELLQQRRIHQSFRLIVGDQLWTMPVTLQILRQSQDRRGLPRSQKSTKHDEPGRGARRALRRRVLSYRLILNTFSPSVRSLRRCL